MGMYDLMTAALAFVDAGPTCASPRFVEHVKLLVMNSFLYELGVIVKCHLVVPWGWAPVALQ